MQFDSTSLSFLQTQKLQQHPKKTNRPIFATQHVKSEQMFQAGSSNVSKSFLYQQQSSNQQKRPNQQNVHAFFAQSENKNPPQKNDTPRQPLNVNSNTIFKPSISSCLRDSRLNESQTQNQDPRSTIHQTLCSPPGQNQKLRAVQSFQNYICNSNVVKKIDHNQSQYSTSKDSNFYDEQISQLKSEIQSEVYLILKEENQNILQRLKLAESQLQSLHQSSVFQIIDTWNQQKVEQNQFMLNLQLKCQDIEIKTDQVEYNQKDSKLQIQELQNIESKRINLLQDQVLEMRKIHHENVEATQKILDKDLQDLKTQFSRILITKDDVERTLHKIIQESTLNTTQGSMNKLNTSVSPNSLRPQDQDSEHLNLYINRYEQFNRDVTNYMASRQVPQQFQNQDLDEMDQAGSLNQSDVENFDNYDLNDSILQRQSSKSPPYEENKFDSRFIKQQNDSNQFDLYDLSKHQQPIEVDQKIKNIYRCHLSAIQEHQMEESCIVVPNQQFIDENGYLLDCEGRYIFDSKGVQLGLTQQQISQMRQSNMLEVMK